MASNYNIMANYIVSKYIERVSGKDLGETFVDDDPSKRVMVGMLSEDRVEAKFEGGYVENTNTRFDSIPSISISFIVKKNESGILHVIPAGLLFYMVQPSYEKTVQYMLERYSEKDSEHYTDILQLCECYPEIKFNLPLTYKKIDIASVMADGIEIKLSDITPGQTFHLKQKISEKLSVLADQIANEICIVSQSRISFFDLTEPDRFRVVTGIKDERVQPRWDIDIVCNVKEEGNTLRFLLQMVNTTPINDKKNIGYLPKIFDAGIRVKGNEGIEFQNIPLDYFSGSYKERNPIFAVTENASAKYHMERNEIRTDNIPIYYQKRLVTKDDLKEYVTFAKLIQNPIKYARRTITLEDSINRQMEMDFIESAQDVYRLHKKLGIANMQVSSDIQIVNCTYGYSRRAFDPKKSMNKNCRLKLNAYDKTKDGSANLVYGAKLDTEGIFFEISQKKIIEWLRINQIIREEQVPDLNDDLAVKKWFAEYVHSDEISMFGDVDENESITKNVFGLLHSMSHAFIRMAGELSGLSSNSLTEIIIVETASIFIYAQTSQGIPLGALSGMAEMRYEYFLRRVLEDSRNCVFDPICRDRDDTACSGCLIIPEISCNHFNAELGRKYMYSIDGVRSPKIGFWEM